LQRDPSWMPASLRVNALSGDRTSTDQAAYAAPDKQGKRSWDMGLLAWGSLWFVIIMFVLVIPNAQWARLEYSKSDGRASVGINPLTVCSDMYEADVNWTGAPSDCGELELFACSPLATLLNDSAVCDINATRQLLENSISNCSLACDSVSWTAYCEREVSVCGADHQRLCTTIADNSRTILPLSYTYSQVSGPAWSGGSRCRPVSTFCDNHEIMSSAGYLAYIGLACILLGQAAVLAHSVSAAKFSKVPILQSSLICLVVGWVVLLAAWVVFTIALGGDTRCAVMNEAGNGALYVHGKFKDIVGTGGLCYGLFICGWCLLVVSATTIAHKLLADRSNLGQAELSTKAINPPVCNPPAIGPDMLRQHEQDVTP